jgi:hypothetical protein
MPKQSETFAFADEPPKEQPRSEFAPAQRLLNFLQRWDGDSVTLRDLRVWPSLLSRPKQGSQRSQNPSRVRLARRNQTALAWYLCVANHSEKYCPPRCRYVAE